MTREVMEMRRLWLSWLELPWDTVRLDLTKEMQRVGMSQEDLAYELRRSGYYIGQKTVSYWLGSSTRKKSPPMDAVQALVAVFARVSVGDWAKGRYLSEAPVAYAS
jgi:hypothetical protein